MPRKKLENHRIEERERDLEIKRDKMKLLREQRKLQCNNEELSFEKEHGPRIQINKQKELERKRERMRFLHLRR